MVTEKENTDSGKKRILVVDDHEDNVEVLRARLEARGAVAAGVQVNATGARVRRDLGVGEADAAHEALERVRAARRDRDLGDVALGLGARESQHVVVCNGIVDAFRDARDRVLTPPLADLDDERDVRAGRDAREAEPAVHVGQRRLDRVSRELHGARVARDALRDGRKVRVR